MWNDDAKSKKNLCACMCVRERFVCPNPKGTSVVSVSASASACERVREIVGGLNHYL